MSLHPRKHQQHRQPPFKTRALEETWWTCTLLISTVNRTHTRLWCNSTCRSLVCLPHSFLMLLLCCCWLTRQLLANVVDSRSPGVHVSHWPTNINSSQIFDSRVYQLSHGLILYHISSSVPRYNLPNNCELSRCRPTAVLPQAMQIINEWYDHDQVPNATRIATVEVQEN